MSREIGGYFELQLSRAKDLPEGFSYLNSARNALRIYIREKNIKFIQVPYYTCPVVWEAILSEGCQIIPYDLDESFLPSQIDVDLYTLYTNYFGVFDKNISLLEKTCKKLIIDNAQAFYSRSQGCASIYSPRKFFGLPDGGLLFPKISSTQSLSIDSSWNRCSHLLKRLDGDTQAGYRDFQENDKSLELLPVRRMSNLTKALMSQIDIEGLKRIRKTNFEYLRSRLDSLNLMSIDRNSDLVPMVYPLRTKKLELRKHLIENKIYVAKYWPKKIGLDCMKSCQAEMFAEEIVPLPIDHRYSDLDMKRIVEVVYE